MAMIRRFMRSEDGATAIEYGLIVTLVSVVGVAAFIQTGTGVNVLMTSVANAWR
jgi:pilus assembly protein Flp/PilA